MEHVHPLDVRSSSTSEMRFRRLFVIIGHGLLVPHVSEQRARDAVAKGHDKYLSVAGPPFPLSNRPGVIITTAPRGKSVNLTQVVEHIGCSPQVVNIPHEMLSYLHATKLNTLGNIEQMMRDMRSTHKPYKFFNHDTEFATRLPGSMMENTVLWARGARLVYGGMWMIDMSSSDTSLVDVSSEFGLVPRVICDRELQPFKLPDDETLTDARLIDGAIRTLEEERRTLCPRMDACHFNRNKRAWNDLRYSDCSCEGELRYAGNEDPITLHDFLKRNQHVFKEDDALVLVSCRNFAKYAEHLEGSDSPESSPRRVKKFGGKKSKRTRTIYKKRYNKKQKTKKSRKRTKI
jgi:hypothetical protein